MRHEGLERLRRIECDKFDEQLLVNRMAHAFDKARPWNQVFKAAGADTEYQEYAFKIPAQLINGGSRTTESFLDYDCQIASSSQEHLATHSAFMLELHGSGSAPAAQPRPQQPRQHPQQQRQQQQRQQQQLYQPSPPA